MENRGFFGNKAWLIYSGIGLGMTMSLLLYHHRLSTSGDNLDYLLIASGVIDGNILLPFRWRFPVLYPYLISTILGLAGYTPSEGGLFVPPIFIVVLKLVGILLIVPVLYIVHRWLKMIDAPYALAVLVLIATAQDFVGIFSIIGSEQIFLLLSLLSLWTWEWLSNHYDPGDLTPDRTSGSLRNIRTVAFLSTFLAIQSRQVGMAIPVAVCLHALISGKWRLSEWRNIVLACAVLPLFLSLFIMILSNPLHLSFLLSDAPVGDHASGSSFGILERLGVNMSVYLYAIPHFVLQKMYGGTGLLSLAGMQWVAGPLALLIYTLIIYAIFEIISNRNRGSITVIYGLAYISIILLWPYQAGRFFIPLIPLLFWLVVCGATAILTKFTRHSTNAMPVLIGLVVIWQVSTNAFAGIKNIQRIREFQSMPPWHHERYLISGETDFADLLACGDWLLNNSEPNARVISSKKLFIEISSRRRADYPQMIDIRMVQAAQGAFPLYIVIDTFPTSARYGREKNEFLLPAISSQPEQFRKVYEGPHAGSQIYYFLGQAVSNIYNDYKQYL
jgi:hypothetical protein